MQNYTQKSLQFLYILLVGLISSHSFATSFVPVSIKNQLKESDGLVHGEVFEIVSIKKDEQIITRVTILADKWIGLEVEENFTEIYYPGGEFENQVSTIGGSPSFQIGETVVLFTKKHKGLNWVHNLGLGKYSVKRIGTRQVIVNQVFPSHPQIGQMNMKKFIGLSEWVKREKFTHRFKDKYELNLEKRVRVKVSKTKSGREIASIKGRSPQNRAENKESSNRLPAYWLVLILGALGLIVGVIRKNHHE